MHPRKRRLLKMRAREAREATDAPVVAPVVEAPVVEEPVVEEAPKARVTRKSSPRRRKKAD
jgi:hypothetical protein